MKANARDADSRLARPDAAIRAYLIYGPDRGRVRERADMLAKALIPDLNDPFAVSQLTDEDVKADPAALADAMAAMSLTGGDRLVRLKISSESGGEAAADFLRDLETGAGQAEAVLIIEAGDLTPRGKLRKTFEPAKLGLAVPCYADNAQSLGDMADKMLAEEGLRLAEDARLRFLPRLEGDRALARGEIEKLILFKGLKDQRAAGEDVITADEVDVIAAGQGEAALDAIIGPTLDGAVSECDDAYARALSGGASPIGVLRALQRRIEQVSVFQSGGEQAAMRVGAPRFGPEADKFRRQAGFWRGRMLERARSLAFETERKTKRSGAPVEALVGDLLLRLASGAAKLRERRR